jgi:tryptophan 2,3-dioxygenase
LEFVVGYKRRGVLTHYPAEMPARRQLERRYHEPTLWDAFLRYLAANEYPAPPDVLARDVTQPIQASPQMQKILIDLYRHDPTLTQVCERLVDLDEGVQEWRYRHIKMVERTIGTKRGTGGSAGVKYLETTLLKPIFPDLWAIRTEL